MAVLQICGFETGDATEAQGAGGTYSYDTTTKRTGGYALRSNPALNGNGYNSIAGYTSTGGKDNLNRTTETFFTFYFRYATLPSSTTILARVTGTGGPGVAVTIQCDGSGNITLLGTTTSSIVATISTDTWYRADLRATPNATSGLSIDGGTEQTVTANAVTDMDVLVLGRSLASGPAYDAYFDDVLIDDTAFPGEGEVRTLRPDGDGTYTAWGDGTGTTFAEVDDDAPGHDSDTTYIKALATSDNTARTFSLTSTATAGVSGAITAAKLVGVCRTEDVTGTSGVGIRIRNGSTDVNTGTREWTTTYVGYGLIQATDPNTGAAWTTGGLDTAEGGCWAGTIAQAQRATAFWLMVWASGSSPPVSENVSGAITPTGALSTKIAPPAVTGGMTPSGTIDADLANTLTGAIIPTGTAHVDALTEGIAGTATPVGVVTAALGLPAESGAVTPGGTTGTGIGVTATGGVAPSGTVGTPTLGLSQAGVVTSSGLVGTPALGFTALGTTSPSGDVGQSVDLQPAGAVGPSGIVTVVITPGVVPPAPVPSPAPTGDQGIIFVASAFPYTERPQEFEVEVIEEQRWIAIATAGAIIASGIVVVAVDQTPLYRRQAQDLMLMGVL